MRYITQRFCAMILALLVLISAVPQLALAAENRPDPRLQLGTFSGDMLDGGGTMVQTDLGLFYLGQEDGFIYNKEFGAQPVYAQAAARLNYADGVLYFARIGEESFDLCAYDVANRRETVLLEHFSGRIGQLYLVDQERLDFLCDSAVWELDLKTGEYRLILHVPELWSFVPTACGLIYAVGTLFDYSIYADGCLLIEHADSYYVDFDLDNGALVYTQNGVDYQMDLADAFLGAAQIESFKGYDTAAATEGYRNVTSRDPESEAALLREAEEAEELDELNAGILNLEINLPPLLQPARDDFFDTADDALQEPIGPTEQEADDPQAPVLQPEETEPLPEPGEPAVLPEEPGSDPAETEDTWAEGDDGDPLQIVLPGRLNDAEGTNAEQPAASGTDFRRTVSQGTENIVKRARQMLNIQWTPRKNVTGWDGRYTYKAGVTYTGLPYGQPVNASYVPWNTDLTQFVAKVNNIGSEMYTSKSTFNKVAPYYSVDCSGFVSWSWDLPYRCTTASINGFAKKISSTTYSGIQVGDMLNDVNSHTVLVTDVTYDRSGTINGIEISEATPTTAYYGCCRSTWYTGSSGLATFRTNYLDRGYAIYRSNTRDSVSYTHECVVSLENDACPLCGQNMFLQPGVDVSTWQGSIDWDTASDYLSFAIIRLGYGSQNLDNQFLRNVKGCEANDLPYGIYLYGLALTPEDARKEAQFVLDNLGSHYPELPIFYDVEELKGNLALADSKLLDVISAFCETIENAGYQAGVYCSAFWWDYKLTSPKYNDWCRWVAHHSASCGAEGGGNLWQYTDNGHVPGISANVDLNYWFGPVGNTDHRFRSVSEPVTCTTDGSAGYVCAECGERVVNIQPAEGHSFVDGVCTVCGVKESVLDGILDVDPDAWYRDAVEFVIQNHLFQGVTENVFAPDAPMNRAMMATVLWRAAGAPENGAREIFSDVSTSAYFSEAVTWAAENEIAKGTTDLTFAPHDTVNREQVVTFLYRTAVSLGMDCSARTEIIKFPDAMQVGAYAREAFSWAVAEGLIEGSDTVSGLRLLPRKQATRAEVAVMIMRFMQLLENP